jgi:hypothetical protein
LKIPYFTFWVRFPKTPMLVEAKDLKSKKPIQNPVFKHGIVSIREVE